MSATTPELWRDMWPRFGRVFAIELALVLAAIATFWALASANVTPAVFKARFTEAWLAMTPGRLEVMERLALGIQPESSDLDEQRNLSRYVSSRRIGATTVVLTGDIPGFRSYEITFWPEVASGEAVVFWRCGRSNLPDSLLPSPCRPGKTS